jgi:sugar/nucleoside kinase (ribokinase family)
MKHNKIQQLIDLLSNLDIKHTDKTAVAGFDGFIDIITRPIACGDSKAPKRYYNDIKEFSSFISKRIGVSSSVELDEIDCKVGGNAPIYSNALGCLGVSTTCIGAFGFPEVESIFKKISENCNIIPVAVPGKCTAIEFSDGKLMLALNGEINSLTWNKICRRAGLEKLIDAFAQSKLIGLFNWGEMPLADDIWLGILNDIVPNIEGDKHVLFDFSDMARRKTKEIQAMLEIVKAYGAQFPTTISLNENEAKAVFEALGIDDNKPLPERGRQLREMIFAANIVFHYNNYTLGITENDVYRYDTFRITDPALTTGAGDNFNAGLSLGLLLGLELLDAIIIASSTSSYYVAYGHSPDLGSLIEFMKNMADITVLTKG